MMKSVNVDALNVDIFSMLNDCFSEMLANFYFLDPTTS